MLSWLNKSVGHDSCLVINCRMCDRKRMMHILMKQYKICHIQPVNIVLFKLVAFSILLTFSFLLSAHAITNIDNSLVYCIFGILYFLEYFFIFYILCLKYI